MMFETLALITVSVLVMTLIPARTLPAVALVLFCILPKFVLPPTLPVYLHPALIVMAFWAVRRLLFPSGERMSQPRATAGLITARTAFVLFLIISSALLIPLDDPSLKNQGFQWLAAVAIGLGAPLLVANVSGEISLLHRVLPWLIVSAGAYAIVEFALAANVVFDPLFADLGVPAVQRWSTYRVHVSFGHPLYAGTFFSAMAAYSFARWLTRRGSVVVVGFAVAGVILTVSRGALLAGSIGAALVLVLALLGRESTVLRKTSAFALIAASAAAVTALGLLQARVGTTEAATSNDARSSIVRVAFDAAASTGWLGYGPGLSRFAIAPFNPSSLLLENAALQLLVSVGLAGIVLLLITLCALGATATRSRNLAAVGALTAFVVSVIGYDGIESLPTLFALLGCITLLCREVRPNTVESSVAPNIAASERRSQ